MDILNLLRPALKVLKAGEVKVNFGLSETRNIQLILKKIFKFFNKSSEDFQKELAVNPNVAIFKLLNNLLMDEWNEETDSAGSITLELLDFMSLIFQTEKPLRNLQWLEILEKFDEFEQRLEENLKKKNTSIVDTTLENTPKRSNTTETEINQKMTKKKKV